MPDLIFSLEYRFGSANNYGPTHNLADGDAVNVDARGFNVLRVIEGAGATATVSEIDEPDDVAHTARDVTTDATGDGVTVTWPLYRVSVSGGTAVLGAA